VSTEPGFPVDLVGTTELHATFREEVRESDRPFRGFLPRKTTPRDLYQATAIANLP
jgi:hypothetical protein